MNNGIVSWLRPWVDWRRKRFWVLVLVLVWTLLGFFAAPALLERQLRQTVEGTGRVLDVADIQVNPYVLSLRITGLGISDSDGTTIIGFDELFVNFQLSSMINWAWTFDEVRLTGLHLEEERFEDGSTRLLRLSGDLAQSAETDASASEEESLARVVVHRLELEDGSVGITDRKAGGFQEQLGPVSISATDLRTLPDHAGQNQVSIVTPEGGVISWQGDLKFVPLASSGHFNVRGKGLPVTLRYIDYFLPISIEGEEVEIDFDYALQGEDGKFQGIIENFEVSTGGIHVRMDGEDETFLNLTGIRMNGGTYRFPEMEAEIESLALDGIDLETWLDSQGRLNLLDALPASGQDSQKADPAAATGLADWDVQVGRVSFNDARIGFEDRRLSTPAATDIEGLNLVIESVDNHEGTRMPAQLSFRLASGGDFAYVGSVTALPGLLLDGNVTVSELGLQHFQPWLSEVAHVNLSEGSVALDIRIAGDPASSLDVEGSFDLNGLKVSDTSRNQSLAAIESLQIERFEYGSDSGALKTSPLQLRGAYGRLHIYEDLRTNLDSLAVSQDDTEPESSGELPNITIASIMVEDGSLDFSDDSLPLPFNAAIRSLSGSLSTLSTTSSEASTVKLEGQVNEFGEARINGSLNPWDYTQSADISMAFRNLEMANLTPYTIQYAGYEIDSGRLDLDLAYTLNQRQMEGQNSIVIRELVLGDKVENPEAASLPLKLAVALLKDSNGVIDVDLPVSGNLDDPTFKISGIVWKAIGNLISKIVTSPFRFLAGLVGADSEDFGTLQFQPGRDAVSPPDREQLLKLAEAMGERPQLSLVITGVYVESLDVPSLKEQAFDEQLDATRALMLESGTAEVIDADRAALEALFTQAFPGEPLNAVQVEFQTPPATGESGNADSQQPVLDEPAYLASLRKRLTEAQAVGETELEALAANRAIAVFEVLEEAAGENPLAVSIVDEVKAAESEANVVPLELEVAAKQGQITAE